MYILYTKPAVYVRKAHAQATVTCEGQNTITVYSGGSIILQNLAEYCLILSRQGGRLSWRKLRQYSTRLSRILALLLNKLTTNKILQLKILW